MTADKQRPTEAEARLAEVIEEYRQAPAKALAARDEGLREVAAMGLRQVDIIRLTGYSRETVRQALKPEARAAVKKATEERRAAKQHATEN